ncbi:hypothetical protein SLNWT_0418 [Streptomyces albus]|uniref:Uncharacterized protein n=1 Tax=Streptomyces albus (strain ATCC 21838 / DSM 41398 / FERM P-419 / JCM 4703 / NBRC 107858) TaxID=1081613 RepID=A0A0B5EHB5_STRA4|nr:hypothetical protein SLNWT_0418 [Streptomyces albus]AOU75105.1 hypothetical protein SLNHY_0414 [Streptomyces albus]AYN30912.1 hypothetical protein DUI70_0409 [Streptomyces albus]
MKDVFASAPAATGTRTRRHPAHSPVWLRSSAVPPWAAR